MTSNITRERTRMAYYVDAGETGLVRSFAREHRVQAIVFDSISAFVSELMPLHSQTCIATWYKSFAGWAAVMRAAELEPIRQGLYEAFLFERVPPPTPLALH